MPTTPCILLAGIVTFTGSYWSAGRPGVKAAEPIRTAAVKLAEARAAPMAKARTADAGLSRGQQQFVVLGDTFIETNEPLRLWDPAAMQKLNEMGVQPLRVIYATIDEHRHNGLVDAQKIIDYVKKYWGPNPSGYFMLDYEIPHLENLMLGLDNPEDPKYIETSQSMVAALHTLRQAFPNAKWTFYGVPGLHFYIPAEPWALTWAQAPEAKRKAELERRLKVYAPLIEAADWLGPAHYDVHEAAKFPTEESRKGNSDAARTRIMTAIAMARDHLTSKGLPQKPIIPLVDPYFGPGGNTDFNKPIPLDEFLRDQVEPAILAGAQGVALWSAIDYFTRIATNQTYPDPNHANQAGLRKTFRENMLGGNEPPSWSSTVLRADLLRIAGQHLVAASAKALEAGGATAEAAKEPAVGGEGSAASREKVIPAKPQSAIRPMSTRAPIPQADRKMKR